MGSFAEYLQLITQNVWLYGGVFVLVLSLLVFVHEWGHYIVARMCGVKVKTFSIGFGKELFGINDSHGTRWKVSLIPLGGYVQMFGDVDPASAGHEDGVKDENGEGVRDYTDEERNVAFFAKPVWQRSLIVLAGPAINFLFAVVVLGGLYGFVGKPVTAPIAAAIEVDSAAYDAGILPHDEIVEINGKSVTSFNQIRRATMLSLKGPMELIVLRDGERVALEAQPKREVVEDRFGFKHEKGYLGIMAPSSAFRLQSISEIDGRETNGNADMIRGFFLASMNKDVEIVLTMGDEDSRMLVNIKEENTAAWDSEENKLYNVFQLSPRSDEEIVRLSFFGSVRSAVSETYKISADSLRALGQIVVGTRSATELGGIIRIGAIAGDMAERGFIALITFTALLSINLGLINLFPIPMLDGGHLAFYAAEAVRGKPVSERIQENAFKVGFVMLIGLMLFANINDLVQLFL
jgi:regulator of sigma E protease